MAQVPNDLNIKFHYNDRLGLKAIVPKAPQSNVGSVYQNSFAVKGPGRLWNMLPKDRTLADNLDSFKTNLDRLLLSFRDTPLSLVMRHRSLTHCWTDQGKETTECCQADNCRVRWPSGSLTLPFQRYSKVYHLF